MDDASPPSDSVSDSPADQPQEMFDELRQLLLEPEREQLQQLQGRLERWRPDPDGLGRILPEAIVRRSKPDAALSSALSPALEEAIQISIKKNPYALAAAIEPIMMPAIRMAIRRTLQSMMQSMNQILENSFTVRGWLWRWEAIRTGKSLAEVAMLHALLYRVEQVFLIHRETGLLLKHVAVDQVEMQDPEAVSGMMTAIQDFVRDAFKVDESETLDTFQVGELTVWVEQGPKAYLAVLIQGNPPQDVRSTLQDTLAMIHREYDDPLDEFQGDNRSFETAEPALEACLLSQRTERRRSLSPVILWFALGVAIGLMGLGLWSWLQAQWRWDGYVAKLQAAPGIVVTHSERRWGHYVINGLRDPLAQDPREFLEGTKIPENKVISQWEPYQALHPDLMLKRMKRVLQPPKTVTLSFQEGALVASGRAPRAWVDRARDITRGFPGIEKWQDDDLTVIE